MITMPAHISFKLWIRAFEKHDRSCDHHSKLHSVISCEHPTSWRQHGLWLWTSRIMHPYHLLLLHILWNLIHGKGTGISCHHLKSVADSCSDILSHGTKQSRAVSPLPSNRILTPGWKWISCCRRRGWIQIPSFWPAQRGRWSCVSMNSLQSCTMCL